MKYTLPFLETMATHACNLSCHGCTNYSNYNVNGNVSWLELKDWLAKWLERVDIPDFGIIGGEPLLNKEVDQWLVGCRELLPDSQLRFTTNGVALLQRARILDTVFDVGNCVFKLSVHQPNQFYIQEVLNLLFNYADWEPVVEHGIKRWRAHNNVRLQINFPAHFYKTFQGDFPNMLPHDSEPSKAFEVCCQKTCPLLHKGKIYKCSSIALLNKTLSDWKRQDSRWDPYTSYQPLTFDSTDQEIQSFIKLFGKPESICRMCPSATDTDSKIDHVSSVITKTQWVKMHG